MRFYLEVAQAGNECKLIRLRGGAGPDTGDKAPAANAHASKNSKVESVASFFKPVDRNCPEYQAEQQKIAERDAAKLAAIRAQNQEREHQKKL